MKNKSLSIQGNSGSIVINNCQYSGNSVVISDNNLFIDGELQDVEFGKTITVHIEGEVESIETVGGSVSAGKVLGSIKTVSGDVNCHDVHGSVTTVSGAVGMLVIQSLQNQAILLLCRLELNE
ncbi:hypothetical protein KCM76_22790 [Zooshikella marina]|uniref:hypothetical protein n=1 Tax=Zooshikella ganghwensis TaxID=202772 RepID=UPI001BB0AEB8|nr:hypothetical protein [Zooshikella ganghwensis]MBU2708839.1 hypothetical protein [Zooshikella ganghwensis]